MIEFFKTDTSGILHQIDEPVKGCWISVVAPSPAEKTMLMEGYHIVPEFLKAALDEEESSYIDTDDDDTQTLVIVDYPEEEKEPGQPIASFVTFPIGVIFEENWLVTICSRDNSTLRAMKAGKVRGLDTRYKTRFLLHMLLLISQEFLTYLRMINRLSTQVEQKLYRSMQNAELIKMLTLDKSLIYFSTSLKADELTLQRILRSRQIPMYEEDRDLMDDVLIEMRQGIEMCQIYSDINSRTSDGFSNVINNNMNSIMKRLTVITIVMSIPNMVYGFYGMNVTGLPIPQCWFPFVLSGVLSFVCWLYFRHNSGFKS